MVFKKGISINRKPLTSLEKKIIINSYLDGESIIKIAKDIHRRKSSISNFLKENDIKVGKNSEGRKAWNNGLKIGKCWNKGLTKKQDNRIKTPWLNKKRSKETIEKIREIKLRQYKEIPELRNKIKRARAKQVIPIKDTSIEVRIQGFLESLGIEYFKHKYINIEHSYLCDIFIPSLNLVIECDGNYWHKYPTRLEIDEIRTKELIESGFKVLRLWESEIKEMDLEKFKGVLNE